MGNHGEKEKRKRPVIGLDLSLTHTGWARGPGAWDKTHFGTISSTHTEMRRFDAIATGVMRLVNGANPYRLPLVVIEGLAFMARDTHLERAGLSWMLRWFLWRKNIPYILIPPTTLKKFVTGSGRGDKSMIQKEVFKRWKIDTANDHEADAVGLFYLGMALIGAWKPTIQAQRDVVAKMRKANQEVIDRLCPT